MKYEIILTPNGHLRLREVERDSAAAADAWMKRVVAAFSSSWTYGLFSLAATKPDMPLSPSLLYWRDFAGYYLTELCRTPEFIETRLEAVEPPSESDLDAMILSAPPMQGGEYVSADTLRDIWVDLDSWVRQSIDRSDEGLAGWLNTHAPMWRRVGRVCFHLAENKHDPEFPFAFMATYAPRLSSGGKVKYLPLGKALQEYAGGKNKKALVNLLSPLHRASEKVDFIREMVDSGDIFHPMAWTPAEAYQLLENVPVLEESGLLLRLPDWWRKRPRPRIGITIGEKRHNTLGVNTLLDFNVDIALGEHKLSREEWERIMAAEDGLVRMKGQWFEVDRKKLSETLEYWKRIEAQVGDNGISFIEGMRLLAGAPAELDADGAPGGTEREWAFVNAGEWLRDTLSGLRNPDVLASGGIGGNFRGTLRHYQKVGCNWLWFLSNLGLGACLADDMGLGKTIQVLSLLLSLKEKKNTDKASLLVLPASLLANWKSEIKRFTPTLRASYIHPSEMDKKALAAITENPDTLLAESDLVLTTYGMLRRQKWLLDKRWLLVILDEAQAIKNPGTRQAKAVKQLDADARIALTGTPIENRLSELWSLFDFLCPGLLGSAAKFKKFVKHLEAREHESYTPLRNLVSPYVLRRLKTDKNIISDLPDKTEMKVFCGLSKRQALLYNKAVEELASGLQGFSGMKRRGLVLAYLMRFKQICNHPSQFLGDGGYDSADSGKFDRLMKICEEIASRQEKVLVFTQFREIIEPIAAFLGGVFGREGIVMHGGTTVKKRKSMIDLFQGEDGPPFFVLSLKAGGTGLNLTAASHVIHFDRWWNPAVENQATDRAFRIGQHRNVVVHKFICRGTVEEKIDTLIEEKINLADDILKAKAESMLTEMSNEELLSAVSLDINRAEL